MYFFNASDRTTTPRVHLTGVLFDGVTHDSLCGIVISSNPKSLNTTLSNIDGEFAFVYTDSEKMVVVRDIFGTRPLYVYMDTSGIMGFSFQDSFKIGGRRPPRPFPKGSYWTSDIPDAVFSLQNKNVVSTVPCTDVLDHVVFLFIRAVTKRVANKHAVVVQTDDVYSDMLSLVCNTLTNPSDRDVVLLSTIGARSLFQRTVGREIINNNDERYTYPFGDRELVAFVQNMSFWTSDMTNMLYNRLFTI
jgi:asparagine synthetase B (glutamine-hydrolysing)